MYAAGALCLHCYLEGAPIMQQLLMHFLLETRVPTVDEVHTPRANSHRMAPARLGVKGVARGECAIIAASVPLLRISSIITYLWVAKSELR
jgi:hypothetical protein